MLDQEFCKKFAGIAGKLSASQIERRRALVIDLIEKRIKDEGLKLTTKNINQVFTGRMFEYIISLIDEHFFENELMARFRENKCCLTACMENRCTSVGGKCWRKGKVFTIKLSTKVLKNAFEMERINRTVNEVSCKSLLKCMLLIFEHELTHAILGCDCIQSAYSDSPSVNLSNYKGPSNPGNGHSKTFMGVVNNRFGHTGYVHRIRGQDPKMEGKKRYKKEDLKKGDVVLIRMRITNYEPEGDPIINIEVPATITRLLKKSFDYVITDKEFFKKVNNPRKTRHEAKGVSYGIISSKIEEFEYESGAPPKPKTQPPSKKVETLPKKVETPPAKANCNKRNPSPPCPIGMHEKARPNGSICCYKGVGVAPKTKKVNTPVTTKSVVKKYKFTVKPKQTNVNNSNNNKPIVLLKKKPVVEAKPKVVTVPEVTTTPKPKVEVAAKPTGKCNNRNPSPPCKKGMTIKRRPDGTKCCYKQTLKAKITKAKVTEAKLVKLSEKVNNELYELDFAYKPIVFDDIDSAVDFKKLSSTAQKYLEKVELFVWNKPLQETRGHISNKNPFLNDFSSVLKTIKNKFFLIKIKQTEDKYGPRDRNEIILVRNEGEYVRYALKLTNLPDSFYTKTLGDLW